MILLDKIKRLTGLFALSKKQHNGDSRSVPIGPNGDGTRWRKVYYGFDGTNSLTWQKTTLDMAERIIKDERPAFGGGTNTTTYAYNDKGQLTTTTEPGRSDTLYEYDELGSIIKVCLDVDNDDSIDESEMDRITASGRYFEQDGSSDWWQVSSNGVYAVENTNTLTTTGYSKTRLTGLSTNLVVETKSIDIFGNETIVSSSVGRLSKTVTRTTDVPDSTNNAVNISINGLLVSSSSPSVSSARTFSYDGLARQTGVTDPRTGTSTTSYNNKGQIASVTDVANNTTSYAYDVDTGLQIAVTNAQNSVTRYKFNVKGLLIHTWGDTVYPVSYSYDDFDRMVSMSTYRDGTNWISETWPEGESADTTQWQYDEATGLLTNKLYADGNGTAYSYTEDGKLETRMWARGITTTYTYTNTTGEMIEINYSDSTPDVTFTSDRIGRQTVITDAQGSRTFAYNPSTLVLTNETIVANGLTNAIARMYDAQGRSEGLTFGDDYSVSYGYSDVGRFGTIDSVVQGITNNWQYSYLANSDLIDKLTSTSVGITNSRSYEVNRDLITEIHNQAQGSTISKYEYSNDEIGRRTQRIDTTASVTTNDFGYDAKSQLTNAVMGAEAFAWVFDNIGNRETYTTNETTYTYLANELNQYTNISNGTVEEPTYDLDGNTLTYKGWTLAWNGENRMTSASNGSTVVSFQYDYMGRRFSKVVEGVSTNLFHYDNWNLISELRSQVSGLSTNFYVWGLDLSGTLQGAGGIGGLLGTCADGNMYFACADGNGNVTDYTDTTGTNVVARYVYGAYGEILASSGDKVDDFNILFSSKYLDRETAVPGCSGMYAYGYRELWDSRWPSRDPIGIHGGKHVYLFLGNNIVNEQDYLGLLNAPLEKEGCCEQALANVWDKLGVQIADLFLRDCLTDISCQNNCGGASGVYSVDKNGKGHICIAKAKGRSVRDITYVILHEIQHAEDRCGGPLPDTCEKCLKGELKAQRCGAGVLRWDSLESNCSHLCPLKDNKNFANSYLSEAAAIWQKASKEKCWFNKPPPKWAVQVSE